jgi:hypothetical protein
MYKIIGADGREYGPVGPEQLRQWIRDGRANERTMAIGPDGGWKALGDYSEFADVFRAGAVPPPPPPPPPPGAAPAPARVTVSPETYANAVLAKGRTVDIGRAIGRGWDLLWTNFGLFLLVLLIMVGIQLIMALTPIVGSLAALLLGGPLSAGVWWVCLKRLRGQPADVGDLFEGFRRSFLQLFLANLVVTILVIFGLALCVLPGIYLAVAWSFALPLVLDKNMEFWPAMEVSRRVLTRHWWSMFGFGIVAFFVCLLGLLALVIGIIPAMGIVQIAAACIYDEFFGDAEAQLTSGAAKPVIA